MRPRKVILLVDPREDRRPITRFVLGIRGYAVLSAPSCFEAAQVAHDADTEISLLLGYAPVSDEYLIDVASGLKCPWLFIGPAFDAGISMRELLDRVKTASSKRRGPKTKIPERSTGNHYGPRIGRFLKEEACA